MEIDSKEKIGIIGRTGSGKLTIALCLFNIRGKRRENTYWWYWYKWSEFE